MTEAWQQRWLDTSLGATGPRGHRVASATIEGAGLALRSTKGELRPWAHDLSRLRDAGVLERLGGICQVFAGGAPYADRLSHSVEVAEIARDIAERLGLDMALAETIGLGHDCGHAPGGHVGERVLRETIGGFTHAVVGSRIVLAGLGLAAEVTEGIESHTWAGPACTTPEAEVVRLADRIAYLTRDVDDALAAGVIRSSEVPHEVVRAIGTDLADQRAALVHAVVVASTDAGCVCIESPAAEAMAVLRRWNVEAIYCSPFVMRQVEGQEQAVSTAIGRLRAEGGSWLSALLRLDDEGAAAVARRPVVA